jgi:hypothetical protein
MLKSVEARVEAIWRIAGLLVEIYSWHMDGCFHP